MRYLFGGLLSLFLNACCPTSYELYAQVVETVEIKATKTVSRLANNSRNATVEVYSYRPEGLVSGTGTVFKYKDQTIVLTAAHIIDDPTNLIMISAACENWPADLVYFDAMLDLAVLTIPDEAGTKAMSLRPMKEKNVKIGQDVIYSGYPNIISLLTIEGYIAGFHNKGYLYLHSYGWSGASGSAVLDTSGRVVGVLVALDVGTDYTGIPSIIEDVVIVVPIWKLNFDLLDLNLDL